MENSERDENSRPPNLPLEKPICRSGNKLELDMEQQQIGKGVRQGCISSPCLFNLYTENIMQTARLDESQAGV